MVQFSTIAQQMQVMGKKNGTIERVKGYWVKTLDDFKEVEEEKEDAPN